MHTFSRSLNVFIPLSIILLPSYPPTLLPSFIPPLQAITSDRDAGQSERCIESIIRDALLSDSVTEPLGGHGGGSSPPSSTSSAAFPPTAAASGALAVVRLDEKGVETVTLQLLAVLGHAQAHVSAVRVALRLLALTLVRLGPSADALKSKVLDPLLALLAHASVEFFIIVYVFLLAFVILAWFHLVIMFLLILVLSFLFVFVTSLLCVCTRRAVCVHSCALCLRRPPACYTPCTPSSRAAPASAWHRLMQPPAIRALCCNRHTATVWRWWRWRI